MALVYFDSKAVEFDGFRFASMVEGKGPLTKLKPTP